MIRQSALAVLWLGFVVYAVSLAPPTQPNTVDLIRRLSSGAWADLNPAVVALFNLMGLWPLAYACLALVDGHSQRFPAWPFVLGSFGLGAFVLLPYLVLRRPNPTDIPPPSALLALLESRLLAALLWVTALGLIVYGLYAGDWGNFVQQWQSHRFIHVMSLDFCLLWLLVPTLLADDMARRGLRAPSWQLAMITAIPLVGVSTYLLLRPSLASMRAIASASSQPEPAAPRHL